MDATEASQAILSRWLTLWPGLSSGVPYVFDNIVRPEAPTFARVAIVSATSEQWTIGPPPLPNAQGSRKWLRRALVDVRLNGPINAGRNPLDVLANYVRQIYEGVRIGAKVGQAGVVTFASTVHELRKAPDSSQLWVLSVTTPFEYYETR